MTLPNNSDDPPRCTPATGDGWRRLARVDPYRVGFQVAFSVTVGTSVAVGTALTKGDYSPLRTLSDYLTLSLGLSSIVALIASITFGFLLFKVQSTKAETQAQGSRFKRTGQEFRGFLEDKHRLGVIDQSYEAPLAAIQALTPNEIVYLEKFLPPLLEAIRASTGRTQLGGEFATVIYRFQSFDAELIEAAEGLRLAFIDEVLTFRSIDFVLKAFATLAFVVVVILIATIHYSGFSMTMLFGAVVGLAVMELLLVLELALFVKRDIRESA